MKVDAVILAAGSGTRFRKSGGQMFKQIVPYKGVPIIKRTVEMLEQEEMVGQIIIVLGDDADCAGAIRNVLSNNDVVFRENLESSSDNNLISFDIGTLGLDKGVIVVEADCIFEHADIINLLNATQPSEICWANIGSIASYNHGGVLGVGDENNIDRIYVFDNEQMTQFKQSGRKGVKMFGITSFGVDALQDYRTQIASYKPREDQYFHAVAMQYPELFTFRTVEMSNRAFSFNVVSEFDDE